MKSTFSLTGCVITKHHNRKYIQALLDVHELLGTFRVSAIFRVVNFGLSICAFVKSSSTAEGFSERSTSSKLTFCELSLNH